MSGIQLSGPRSLSAQELSRSTKRTADCVNNHLLQGPVTLLHYTNVVFLAEIDYPYGRLIHEVALDDIGKVPLKTAKVAGTTNQQCDRRHTGDNGDWPWSGMGP